MCQRTVRTEGNGRRESLFRMSFAARGGIKGGWFARMTRISFRNAWPRSKALRFRGPFIGASAQDPFSGVAECFSAMRWQSAASMESI
jgi:hypothetical protein